MVWGSPVCRSVIYPLKLYSSIIWLFHGSGGEKKSPATNCKQRAELLTRCAVLRHLTCWLIIVNTGSPEKPEVNNIPFPGPRGTSASSTPISNAPSHAKPEQPEDGTGRCPHEPVPLWLRAKEWTRERGIWDGKDKDAGEVTQCHAGHGDKGGTGSREATSSGARLVRAQPQTHLGLA